MVNISWDNKVLTSDPARQQVTKCFWNFVFAFVYIARIYILFRITNKKKWIHHSDHKTPPFSKLHNMESLFSGNQLCSQKICRATKLIRTFFIIFWSQIWGSSYHGHYFPKLHGRFVPLPQLMTIGQHRDTKHSFLMMQALVTCCQRLLGQNTCSFAEITQSHFLWIYTANSWLQSMCMHSGCNLPLLCGGPNQGTKRSQEILIQTGLGLRYTTWKQLTSD